MRDNSIRVEAVRTRTRPNFRVIHKGDFSYLSLGSQTVTLQFCKVEIDECPIEITAQITDQTTKATVQMSLESYEMLNIDYLVGTELEDETDG